LVKKGIVKGYLKEQGKLEDWQEISVVQFGGGLVNDRNFADILRDEINKKLAQLIPDTEFKIISFGASEKSGVIGATYFVPEEERKGKSVVGGFQMIIMVIGQCLQR